MKRRRQTGRGGRGRGEDLAAGRSGSHVQGHWGGRAEDGGGLVAPGATAMSATGLWAQMLPLHCVAMVWGKGKSTRRVSQRGFLQMASELTLEAVRAEDLLPAGACPQLHSVFGVEGQRYGEISNTEGRNGSSASTRFNPAPGDTCLPFPKDTGTEIAQPGKNCFPALQSLSCWWVCPRAHPVPVLPMSCPRGCKEQSCPSPLQPPHTHRPVPHLPFSRLSSLWAFSLAL